MEGSSAGIDQIQAALNTLDEPIMDTFMRDINRIWNKLQIVINPFDF